MDETFGQFFKSKIERGIIMSKFGSTNSAKDWVRLAAKLSLLFTEPKVRAAISDRFKDHLDDVTDRVSDKYDDVANRVSDKYDDAADRLEAAAEALQGKSHWPAHLTGFLLGAGVGVGLGILLAPASGSDTRQAVADATSRAFESASDATARIRQSVSRMPSTGTEG
jgi:gas vesicle protein